MKNTVAKPFLLCGAIAGLALLPACSGNAPEEAVEGTQEDTTITLAAALSEVPDLASLNGAISSAQLMPIFESAASYTLLAPHDDAFAALGQQGQALMTDEQRPLLAGVLREHILPGHLTPENVRAAIESQGGEVKMTTLGGDEITFSLDDGELVATNPAGESARFVGNAIAATNGVIIPVDTVLVPGEPG